ncbi:hypothetical protein M408DRAFT_269984 [Serendipita vermifera MAFF 305830]|uniref:Uncharacterized protein n=1 Tax=Serendipita vermifera MAFF 305830 TaxID=933852 RepID=A0A0C3BF60_SERVB|nr:hypothetical protein M408DRAFT_269984 [Serendipita vermifera MAFF 305830]
MAHPRSPKIRELAPMRESGFDDGDGRAAARYRGDAWEERGRISTLQDDVAWVNSRSYTGRLSLILTFRAIIFPRIMHKLKILSQFLNPTLRFLPMVLFIAIQPILMFLLRLFLDPRPYGPIILMTFSRSLPFRLAVNTRLQSHTVNHIPRSSILHSSQDSLRQTKILV